MPGAFVAIIVVFIALAVFRRKHRREEQEKKAKVDGEKR
jgi:hypothetical protein